MVEMAFKIFVVFFMRVDSALCLLLSTSFVLQTKSPLPLSISVSVCVFLSDCVFAHMHTSTFIVCVRS